MPSIQRVLLFFIVTFVSALGQRPLPAADETAQSPAAESPSPKEARPHLFSWGGKQCEATCSTWCADDYCPKCLPVICPPCYCGGCDCYDVKCAPSVCPPSYCGGCDCYDPKCAPCVTIPRCFRSFYKCPPPGRWFPWRK